MTVCKYIVQSNIMSGFNYGWSDLGRDVGFALIGFGIQYLGQPGGASKAGQNEAAKNAKGNGVGNPDDYYGPPVPVNLDVKMYGVIRAGQATVADNSFFQNMPLGTNANQLDLVIGVNDPLNYYSELQFVQTINEWENGKRLQMNTLDKASSNTSMPFYNSNSTKTIGSKVNAHVGMADSPCRLSSPMPVRENIPNITWEATTSVFGRLATGKWQGIMSFTWGFNINSAGIMTSIPMLFNITPNSNHIKASSILNK